MGEISPLKSSMGERREGGKEERKEKLGEKGRQWRREGEGGEGEKGGEREGGRGNNLERG
jgi:hypothetical protein